MIKNLMSRHVRCQIEWIVSYFKYDQSTIPINPVVRIGNAFFPTGQKVVLNQRKVKKSVIKKKYKLS